jgi:hypothetical protein
VVTNPGALPQAGLEQAFGLDDRSDGFPGPARRRPYEDMLSPKTNGMGDSVSHDG